MSGYSSYMAGHEPRIFIEEVLIELAKARSKFTVQDVWVTLAALTEEVGELNQAILQLKHEPEKGKTIQDVRKEACQVAVMAIRVILDAEF
jgi:NTP pyrophosphatase (non-canonical NTP hydrolase)